MKIGEIQINQCGICPLIDWCGDPWEEPHFCCDSRLKEITVEEFTKLVEKEKTE